MPKRIHDHLKWKVDKPYNRWRKQGPPRIRAESRWNVNSRQAGFRLLPLPTYHTFRCAEAKRRWFRLLLIKTKAVISESKIAARNIGVHLQHRVATISLQLDTSCVFAKSFPTEVPKTVTELRWRLTHYWPRGSFQAESNRQKTPHIQTDYIIPDFCLLW